MLAVPPGSFAPLSQLNLPGATPAEAAPWIDTPAVPAGRRRLVDPTRSERDYDAAEAELTRAMAEYKRRSGRMFPTWSEVLEVLVALGYERRAGGCGSAL